MIDHVIYRPKIGVFLHPRATRTMAYILLLQDVANRALTTERIFQDHVDLFAESGKYLLGHFRPPRAVLMEFRNSLEPTLRNHTRWSYPVPPHVQILSTLGFLDTFTFHQLHSPTSRG